MQPVIYINEIFPAPSNGSEWIELFNSSSTEIVELENWFLFDQLSSPSKIHTFTTEKIYPQSFLVIELNSSKLNNSADGVILINSSDETVDEMHYENSETDLSWSKNQLGEFQLTQPTQGTANFFPSPSPTLIPSSIPSPSPSPSPSPKPKANSPSTTPKPTIIDSSSPSPSPPPTFLPKPKLPYSPSQIFLGSNSAEAIQLLHPQNQFFTQSEPSLLPTLSVILGGLLLFLAGSWRIYEKFWKNKKNS